MSLDSANVIKPADPGSKWHRCTHCGDADFCFTCYQKDIHSEHKAYLQLFTSPENWIVPHCDACGHSFSDENGTLYKCSLCEDFCLCLIFKTNLLHMNHLKHLKETPVSIYTDELGQS